MGLAVDTLSIPGGEHSMDDAPKARRHFDALIQTFAINYMAQYAVTLAPIISPVSSSRLSRREKLTKTKTASYMEKDFGKKSGSACQRKLLFCFCFFRCVAPQAHAHTHTYKLYLIFTIHYALVSGLDAMFMGTDVSFALRDGLPNGYCPRCFSLRLRRRINVTAMKANNANVTLIIKM